MAGYGLKIFDADGNVTLDTTDAISRFRYSNEVAAGASGNTTLSDISGLSSVEMSVQLSIGRTNYAAHWVGRSGTTITWTAQSGYSYVSVNSLIFIFLYT